MTRAVRGMMIFLLVLLLCPRQGSGVLWWAYLSVCVCLSAIISSELRSSSGGVAICYVLPILWMTSVAKVAWNRRPAEAQCTRSLGFGYKLCAVIPVAGQRAYGTTFRALKATSQVATPGGRVCGLWLPCLGFAISGSRIPGSRPNFGVRNPGSASPSALA